jgi:hypothetical protein
MNMDAEYRHTQRSPVSAVLIVIALGIGFTAWALRDEPQAALMLSLVSVLIAVVAGCFHQLTVTTVTDEESGLLLQFGPIPLFHKRIPYASLRSVEPSRSSIVDGWGIHYIPWRGWTYNLWGFSCVLIQRDNKSRVRIGTDDADGLFAFLRTKLEQRE